MAGTWFVANSQHEIDGSVVSEYSKVVVVIIHPIKRVSKVSRNCAGRVLGCVEKRCSLYSSINSIRRVVSVCRDR